MLPLQIWVLGSKFFLSTLFLFCVFAVVPFSIFVIQMIWLHNLQKLDVPGIMLCVFLVDFEERMKETEKGLIL